MSLILPNSIFIHFPKTGGTAITNFFRRAYSDYISNFGATVTPYSLGRSHGNTSDMPDRLKIGKQPFMFIRNPITWYESFFNYKKGSNWDDSCEIDKRCNTDSLEDFINKCYEMEPEGIYSKLIKYYMEADPVIGRYETLEKDLKNILGYLEFIPQEEIKLKSTNVSKNKEHFPKELADMIVEKEEWVFDRFNFNKEIL